MSHHQYFYVNFIVLVLIVSWSHFCQIFLPNWLNCSTKRRKWHSVERKEKNLSSLCECHVHSCPLIQYSVVQNEKVTLLNLTLGKKFKLNTDNSYYYWGLIEAEKDIFKVKILLTGWVQRKYGHSLWHDACIFILTGLRISRIDQWWEIWI